jgi:DNA-binding LytR/AlgR family response regulator
MHDNIYSVFIAEDEEMAINSLLEFITSRSELRLAGISKNGDEALEKLTVSRFDLLILDIHLPHLSAIEVLEGITWTPFVIFTTAHDQYAIKAFDIGAVDYLIKPFSIQRFNRAIDKFIMLYDHKIEKERKYPVGFSFKDKGKYRVVPYKDIVYFSSHAKNTIIHTDKQDYESMILLKDIEIKLPPDNFRRVHKQFIVNINYIESLEYYLGGQYMAYLNDVDETSIPIGKKYAPILKEILQIET